uniref:Putative DD34D transposase n=1 Tax=Bactrocera tryoni TaxID=59916 RepID=A0A1L5BY03_BACRY|nr:putative DD34D transposase [Bactrocera tryoni]
MHFEQRANIKFCFKLGKTFTETFQMMKKVYGDQCLSRSNVHEWFKRFQEGREDLCDDQKSGRPKSVITQNNIEKVQEFIKNEPKSSLRYMEMELNITKDSIHRILIDKLGLRKVCSKFVPHKLTEEQKLLRIQHCKDLIKESRKDINYKYSIVTGDETWCFQYDPETKRQSAEWKHPDEPSPKKSRLQKSKIKTMLICFYDSEGIVHREFVPPGQTINAVFYLGVMKRLLSRIRRARPQYREAGSWRLLHDNAPCHRSTLVTDFLTKNSILTINHSPYSPDLAPCDFYLFGKLHLPMKGHWFQDISAIQKATTDILKSIPKNDLKHSFEMLIDRAKRCIEAQGNYFE